MTTLTPPAQPPKFKHHPLILKDCARMLGCAALLLGAMLLPVRAQSQSVTVAIDGSQTYQTIDGFGVNANHRSWTNNELQPVLDALIDQAGMTLFRVVYDKADWEAVNDNSNPDVMNWNYYTNVYSSADFEAMWGLVAYLNQKGITNGVMFNFQGTGPAWMMNGSSLGSGYEDEWAETVASLLIYARNWRHLQFDLVGPGNEPDNAGDSRLQGILMTTAQYLKGLHKLARLLELNGLGDVRFVGPDLASSSTDWLTGMMNDPAIMTHLAHFGLHSYQDNGVGSVGVYDFLQQSAYADRNFWMTEFNVWCSSCENCTGGDDTWAFARGSADYLLNHLANGASAGLVWEGYDSFYRLGSCWSYWGLFAVDDVSASSKTYTPRKGFYTLAQISKFVRPGAQRIGLTGTATPVSMLAFYQADSGQFTLVGVNASSSEANITGTLTHLPPIAGVDLYYTDALTNLCHGGSVPLANGTFTTVIPPDCVFTLTGARQSFAVSLRTNGYGRISPDLSVRALASGQTYTLVAIPDSAQGFAGWTGSITSATPRLSFTLTSNLVLEADFVPGHYLPEKGVYNGLFYPSDGVSQQSSGLFTLATTTSRKFSGRLQLGSVHYPLSGSFDGGGHARLTPARNRLNSLSLEMQMDLASGSDTIIGSVSNGTWTAGLSARRAVLRERRAGAASIGPCTFILPGAEPSLGAPAGDSCGTTVVDSAGRVRLSIWLADGTKGAQLVALSTNREFPLYISLCGGAGSLLGWMTFADAPAEDLGGVLAWARPALPKSQYYPRGFTMAGTAHGSRYNRLARGQRMLNLTNAEIVFGGGPLVQEVTNKVMLSLGDRVRNLSSNTLRLNFVSSSGLFHGSVALPVHARPLFFNGVVLQNQRVGSGYFLDTNQTGRVLFCPTP